MKQMSQKNSPEKETYYVKEISLRGFSLYGVVLLFVILVPWKTQLCSLCAIQYS